MGIDEEQRYWLERDFVIDLLKQLPLHIFWKNKDSVYLGCNDAFAHSLGLSSPEEVIGKTDHDLPTKKEESDAYRADDKYVMESSKPKLNIEEYQTLPDGQKIVLLTNKVPLLSKNGEVIGVLGIYSDITERKKMEQALTEQNKKIEKAYRSKGRFIAQASHEIRNPISSVSSSLMLIKERLDKLQVLFYEKFSSLNELDAKIIEELNTTFSELFEFYNGATEKTDASLVALKNLEKLHLLELEGLEPKWELNSISGLIDEAIEKSTYPNNGKVDLKVNIDNNVPEEAIVDYNHVYDALTIFIGNAIRFSSQNQQVLIGVKSSQVNDTLYLDFTVQDFGIGISKEQLDDLFKSSLEEEFTIDVRLKKPSIQLKRAKLMVEASGGTLAIRSILKLGTIIIIRVPYRLPKEQTIKQKSKNYLLKELASLIQYRILIVEDELAIQKATLKQLNELGFELIDVASSGNEAIKKGMQNNYDIIFVDFTLPDINGINVVEHLLKKKNENIIFIGITSHTSEEAETYALKQGVMEVLFKPISKVELTQALHVALQIIQENGKQGDI